MKVARLFKGFGEDGHMGFVFFENRHLADAEFKKLKNEGELGGDAKVEMLDAGPPTRDTLVRFLNQYAAHPDNG